MRLDRISTTIRSLLIATVLLFNIFSPMGIQTAHAAGATDVSPGTVTAGDTINISFTYYSPNGANTIQKLYMAFSPCNLEKGEAYNSNFERRLANYFGVVIYDPQSSAPSSFGLYRANPGTSCTGGQYGDPALVNYYVTEPNVWNANNTLRYNRFSTYKNGNYLTVSANVTFGTNFPAGTYYYYFMVYDGEWHTPGPYWSKTSKTLTVNARPGTPSISCTPSAGTSGWVSGNITCSATSANASYLQYTTNATANSTWTGWTNGSSVTVGYSGQVYFRGISPTGAAGPEAYKSVYSDTSNPTAPGVTCSPSGWTAGDVTCSVSTAGTDRGSGVSHYQYSTDNTNWTKGTSFKRTTAGYAYFRTVDNVGRASSSASAYAYIDKTAPTAPTVSCSPASGVWTTGNVTCTASGSTDAHSGLQSETYDYQFSRDGTNFSYITGDAQAGKDSVTVSTPGYIYFRSVDNVWLASSVVSVYARINQAPTNIGLSATSVGELAAIGTSVGTLSVTDPDNGYGDSYTYSLVSGTGSADNASFTISGNTLKTAASFNYDAKSSYAIRVRVTDGGGKTFEKPFTISITNVNEAITDISLSNASVVENAPAGTTVGTLSNNDPDGGQGVTYSLVSGAGGDDNASFTITGNTLKTAASFNYEAKPTLSIRVRATDGALTYDEVISISVLDVNEGPTSLEIDGRASSELSVSENEPAGTEMGEFVASDPDSGAQLTYSLVAGEGDADNAEFMISGSSLLTAATFDFETRSSYSIRVQVSDGEFTFERSFTITVLDAAEAPTEILLSGEAVAENAAPGTAIGTLSASDPDLNESHTFTLVSGEGDADNSAFTIEGDALKIAASADFEAQSSYSIRARVTDRFGLTYERIVTITVEDRPEAPTDILLSGQAIVENAAPGTTVGALSAADPDLNESHTFTLVSGEGDADNSAFVIVDGQLQTAADFDFEGQSSYSIRLRVEDKDGQALEKSFVITVTDLPEFAPEDILLSGFEVDENSPAGSVVGQLSAVDGDAVDTLVFALVEGEGSADNASFVIEGDSLKTAAVFDYEARMSYSIRVRVTDLAGMSYEKAFTIQVRDVPELAVGYDAATLAYPENTRRAVVTVSLSMAASEPVRVFYYTAGDTAVAGQDYTDVLGTLYFAPGQTTRTFVVPMVNDLEKTGTRSVLLFLENPQNAPLGRSQAVLQIIDDETDTSFSTDLTAGPANLAYDLEMGRFSAYIQGVSEESQIRVTAEVDPEVPIPSNFGVGSSMFEIKLVNPDTEEDVAFTRATICLPYTDAAWQNAGIEEDDLRLLHYENGEWVDVTNYVDMEANQICGRTESFSPFAIVGGMADTTGGQIVLTSGSLAITPELIDFGAVSLTGEKLEVPGTTSAWFAVDASGTGAGWHVEISASDFADGMGHFIPVCGFKIDLPDEAIAYIDGNDKPASQITGLTPIPSGDPLTIARAAEGKGMGQYSLTPTFTLDVPPSTYAGSYTSIVTVVAVSGP